MTLVHAQMSLMKIIFSALNSSAGIEFDKPSAYRVTNLLAAFEGGRVSCSSSSESTTNLFEIILQGVVPPHEGIK